MFHPFPPLSWKQKKCNCAGCFFLLPLPPVPHPARKKAIGEGGGEMMRVASPLFSTRLFFSRFLFSLVWLPVVGGRCRLGHAASLAGEGLAAGLRVSFSADPAGPGAQSPTRRRNTEEEGRGAFRHCWRCVFFLSFFGFYFHGLRGGFPPPLLWRSPW